MLREFREFIARGNVIDLAVGVIIGAAFGKIVTTLVEGIIMPPIGLALGRIDFASLFYVLDPSRQPASLAEAIGSLYARDLDALGAAARQHVESSYSWTRALQGLMTRYQAVVSARQRMGVETALPSAGSVQ